MKNKKQQGVIIQAEGGGTQLAMPGDLSYLVLKAAASSAPVERVKGRFRSMAELVRSRQETGKKLPELWYKTCRTRPMVADVHEDETDPAEIEHALKKSRER